MKYFLVTLTAIVISLQFHATLHAQSAVGLSVFPAIVEYPLVKGEQRSDTIQVRNTSQFPLPIGISARALEPFDTVVDAAEQSRYDASQWVDIETSEALLPVGGDLAINFSISVPEDASPGGHYAEIVIRQLRGAAQPSDENQATVLSEINALLLITVDGEINESLTVQNNDLIAERVVRGSTHSLSLSLENNGNVHVLPLVTMRISKGDTLIDTINFQPQIILPNTVKTLSHDWTADVGLGEYTIETEVTYGSQQQRVNLPPVNFRVIPPLWQFIVVAGSLLLIAVFSLRWRQIPRVFNVLRGRAAGVRGSYHTSAGEDELDKDTSSYQEVIDELERSKPILGMPESDEAQLSTKSSKLAKQLSDKELDSRRSAKTDDLVDDSLSRNAVVSQEVHPESHSKTVIIQTSSSTIVREEPLTQSSPEPKTSTPSRVIKIPVTEDSPARKKSTRATRKKSSKTKKKSKK